MSRRKQENKRRAEKLLSKFKDTDFPYPWMLEFLCEITINDGECKSPQAETKLQELWSSYGETTPERGNQQRRFTMSNLPTLTSTLPAYMQKDPAIAAALLDEALSGITGGSAVPSIRAKGTRFIFKKPGQDDVMHNELELKGIILRAKAAVTKKWYATKFVEGQEPQAPDCFSMDGVKPDASSRNKQCENCASCAMNVFGSGTNAQGEAGKGKACSDTKELAVYVNKMGIFSLPIMPTALGRWKEYVKTLGAHGRTPSDVITVVGFDPTASFPSYTFAYGGDLPEAAYGAVQKMLDCDEVSAIINPAGSQAALPAPAGEAAKQVTAGPSEDELAAAREAKAKAAKDEADKKAKAAAAKAKKDEEAKAKAAAAAPKDDIDLGLDFGGEATGAAGGATTLANADVDDVVSALGLDL